MSEQRRSKQAKSPVKDRASKESDLTEKKLKRVESRNSGGGLPIQGSIHTIKEYDFTDEDDI